MLLVKILWKDRADFSSRPGQRYDKDTTLGRQSTVKCKNNEPITLLVTTSFDNVHPNVAIWGSQRRTMDPLAYFDLRKGSSYLTAMQIERPAAAVSCNQPHEGVVGGIFMAGSGWDRPLLGDFFGQFGHELQDVGHDAHIGHLKDGGLGIFVDGDHKGIAFDPAQMLE